jgi:parallel beta-helix repeat protein
VRNVNTTGRGVGDARVDSIAAEVADAEPAETQPPTTQPPTTQPPTTQPPVSAITLSPGADVAAAVAAAPAGSSFYLKNGTYAVGAIVPKSGDTIAGQSRDGVILDGGMARPNAFGGSAANVTLTAMTVQHYVPARLVAAIDGTRSSNWTMSNLHVTNNNEEGLAVGPGSLVDNILADHNGNVGIGTGAVNNDPYGQPFANLIFTVQNSELSYNGAQDSADAAGAKVLFTNGATFTNNYVHNNYGFGLWTDAYNTNTIYQNNHVTNNQAGGIFHEISYAAIIRNNVVSGNAIGYCTGLTYFCGTGGISISDSHDVQVYGNTLTANHDSIVAYNGHSQTGMLYNLQVHDNIFTDTAGTTGIQTWPYVANAYATSHWVNNTYQTGQHFYWTGNLIDITAFHNAGQS